MILVPIVAGIIGAIIAYKLYRVGLSIVGFLGGAALALLLLSFKTNGIIKSLTELGIIDVDYGRVIFIVVLGVVGAVLINFFEFPVIVGATALLGSFTVFLGIGI